MKITIRPATEADLPAVLTLYAELNPDDPPLSADSADAIWTAVASQQGRTLLVAELDGCVVGTADCLILPNLTRGGRSILFVENVVVGSAHRRYGIGRKLMAAAVRLAESADCYKVQLLAADDEYVHTFYRSCGFEPRAQGFRHSIDRPLG